VARVAALIPDLLFGSKVAGMLRQAGHDVELVTSGAEAWTPPGGVDVVIVDLVSDAAEGVAVAERLRGEAAMAGVRTLAVYSHVDAETRRRAVDAGFDLVVPRSRMVREGAALVAKLGTP
jgi:DNA-binding response OmpR family regulator